MNGFFRALVVAFGVLVVGLAVGASEASAAPKPVQHCITPTSVDLNVRWAVSEAIVAPFCPEVASGRRWTVSNAWFMNTFFQVVPLGFVPAGATPVDDFKAKFIGVKYVVDPGTKQQKIYQFPSDDSLGVVLNADGFDIVSDHARHAEALERWSPRGRHVLPLQRDAL